MFGLGSIVSKLAGPLLDKIGLGFITPLISMAVNFASGNYAAMIGDVVNLVGKFTDSSFLNNVASKPPLGVFQNSQGNSGSKLSLGNLIGMSNNPFLKGLSKVMGMVNTVIDYKNNSISIQNSRSQAQFGSVKV